MKLMSGKAEAARLAAFLTGKVKFVHKKRKMTGFFPKNMRK